MENIELRQKSERNASVFSNSPGPVEDHDPLSSTGSFQVNKVAEASPERASAVSVPDKIEVALPTDGRNEGTEVSMDFGSDRESFGLLQSSYIEQKREDSKKKLDLPDNKGNVPVPTPRFMERSLGFSEVDRKS